METFLMKAFQLIMALALLVTVHEFGHYIFARIFGIKVEKFFLFFNPRFSLMRYIPEQGRLELCTWMDKEEKPHPLASWKVGRAYAPGEKVPGWKQTIYGIGWIPLGGYCSIAGMVDETKDASDVASTPADTDFYGKAAWKRLLVMAGGVIFNFLLAIIIFVGLTFSYGEKTVKFRDAYAGMDYVPAALKAGFRNGDIPLKADGQDVEADQPGVMMKLARAKVVTVLRNGTDTVDIHLPADFMMDLNEDQGFFAYRVPVVVSEVMRGEPAAKAGLQKDDNIIAVGDSLTPSLSEFFPALKAYSGKSTPLKIIRDGKQLTLTATPTADGKLGFMLTPPTDIYPVFTKNYGLVESFPRGWTLGTTTLKDYVGGMSQIFTKRGAESLGGFGALGGMFPEKWNWYQFWSLTAFLSIALAFMNIIPIPGLDGGHILFLFVEMITRRKVPLKVIEVASTIGFYFLLALMLFANMNDIMRLFK
ncbi:MAG: RIP metalloprotease RseP [Bacteroidales bacterium]|nr:RIP metalloprotease RseP [Bacteroidales bacterium]MBD5294245.1 RIP metalloprotease RseP [Bacteroides sp.]MBD5361648.1 RIP metalloprotease RseP [Bacteroides sp.]